MIHGANRKWWVLAGVSIISFLGCIDFTIVNTAAPAIQDGLHATVTELQWVVNVFVMALSAFMVTMGRLADTYGRRLVLYIGSALFGLASLAAGLSTDMRWLIACRFVQGACCAILYTSSSAIVSNAFPERERGKAIGALYGVNGIGLAIGPMLGGVIVSALSWRWVFLINVPLIMVGLLISFASVQESRSDQRGAGVDWPGLALLAVGLPALILGLTLGDTWGWGSAPILTSFGIGLASMILFYVVEQRVESPIVQFRLFANRTFVGAMVADFGLAFFYCLAFFLMPLYLHSVRHYEGYMIGVMLLPSTAMVAILSPVVGRLVDRVGPRALLCVGFASFALSGVAQARFSQNSSVAYIVCAFTMMGIGWAFVLGPATVAALSSVPERSAGVAVGSSWTFHNLGGAIGLAAGLAVYRWSAQQSLVNGLAAYRIPIGEWTHEVVANPEAGLTILRSNAHLDSAHLAGILEDLITSGYRAAMWLLFGTSISAFLVISIGLRRRAAPSCSVETGEVGPSRQP